MPGLVRIAAGRPAFNAGAKQLAFDVGVLAPVKGQLLIAIAAFDAGDSLAAVADGWTTLYAYVGTAKVTALARMVDDDEPDKLVLSVTSAARDWLGALLLYATSAPSVVLEQAAGADFAAAAAPSVAPGACQQAINLELVVWSVAGAIALTAPAGWTQVDSYSTAIATARSLLVAEVVAGATGALAAATAAAAPAATGSALALVLRDRHPIKPATLEDPLSGNLGLFGADLRPPREAGLP